MKISLSFRQKWTWKTFATFASCPTTRWWPPKSSPPSDTSSETHLLIRLGQNQEYRYCSLVRWYQCRSGQKSRHIWHYYKHGWLNRFLSGCWTEIGNFSFQIKADNFSEVCRQFRRKQLDPSTPHFSANGVGQPGLPVQPAGSDLSCRHVEWPCQSVGQPLHNQQLRGNDCSRGGGGGE